MKVTIILDRDDVAKALQGWPCIVEGMEMISRSGRRRKAYRDKFNEAERVLLKKWYDKMYDWHLKTGVPAKVVMHAETIVFLSKKAIPFMASI